MNRCFGAVDIFNVRLVLLFVSIKIFSRRNAVALQLLVGRLDSLELSFLLGALRLILHAFALQLVFEVLVLLLQRFGFVVTIFVGVYIRCYASG